MAKKFIRDKNVMYMGIGGGVGLVQCALLKRYYDIQIPGTESWGMWGATTTVVPIATGIVALALSRAKYVKKKTQKDVLDVYGIVSIIGGITNALIVGAQASAFYAGRGTARASATPWYAYSAQTKAAGWGSDLSRAPSATIPTQFPKTTIIA